MSARLGASFWRLFASSATSNLADGVSRTAIPLLGASLTRDPVLISALGALAFLPWLLFAVPGGALVDRVDRRRAMSWANAFRAVVMAGLVAAVFTGAASIAVLFAVAFAIGLAEVIYDSAARAILPQVVGKDLLDKGNGALTVEETVGQTFVGAPLGAFLFAAVAAVPFLGSAAGFLIAAGLIMAVRGDFKPRRSEQTPFRADVAEGLRWLWRHSFLRAFTITSGLTGFLQAMPNAVLVLFALEVLRVPEGGFGLLLVAAGVGGLAGGLLAARLSARFGRVRCLALAGLLAAAAVGLMGTVTNAYVAGTLFALAAGASVVWNALSMSMRQAMIPEELFGRVLGVYRMIIWGVIPVGSLLGGVLAAATSLSTVFVIAGSAQVAVAGYMWALLRRHRGEIETAYAEPAPASA